MFFRRFMWRLTYVLPALFMSLLFILRAPPRKVAKGLVGLKVLRKFTSFFLVRQKKIIMKLKGGPWVHDFETLVDFTDLLLMKSPLQPHRQAQWVQVWSFSGEIPDKNRFCFDSRSRFGEMSGIVKLPTLFDKLIKI